MEEHVFLLSFLFLYLKKFFLGSGTRGILIIAIAGHDQRRLQHNRETEKEYYTLFTLKWFSNRVF